MAKDPIDEFIALPKDQQLSTLQQLSPEKQNKLLGEIKTRKSRTNLPSGVRISGTNAAGRSIYAPVEQPKPTGSAWGRLASSAGAAIGGAVSGLYHGVVEGPQNPEEAKWDRRGLLTTYRMLIAPAKEQAQQAASEFKQAQAATPWTSFHPSPRAKEHREKAVAHTLAAIIPGAGPLAAQVSEQAATQYGTGDVAGAAGTLAGNAALFAMPKVAGAAGRLVPRVGRSAVEALSDTGPGGLKRMAQETIKANADAAEKAARDNADAAKKHLEKTKEAIHETAGRERAYAGKVKSANELAREKHAAETAKVKEANARIVKKHADQRLQAMKKNKETLAKYTDEVAKVQKDNADVLRDVAKRKETQQKLGLAEQELDQKIKTQKTEAKADDDAAWKAWREKVGTPTTPSDEIVAEIKASTSSMDPEDVTEFRRVLKETRPDIADMSEVQATRDEIVKGNKWAENYENASPQVKQATDKVIADLGLDPDEAALQTKPIGALRLHVIKTQLEYAVRNATRGNVRYAIGRVLDKVRDAETALSKEAGADEELAVARKLHGPYKDTFVNSPNEPATVASTVQAKVTPEFKKESMLKKQLAMLGKYDASIPQLAEHIDNLRRGLKELPEEGPLREKLKPLPPAPKLEEIPAPPTLGDVREGYRLQQEPVAPAPAEETIERPERVEHPNRPEEITPKVQTIGPKEYRAKQTAQAQAAAEQLRRLGVRRALNALFYTVPGAALSTLLGHPGWAIAEVAQAPVVLLGSHALANLLERPEFAKWVGTVTPKVLQQIDKLPPEERAVFTQNMRQAVNAAQKKRMRISPALTAYVVGSAATTKTPKQLREEAQRLQQQGQQQTQEETPEPTDEETPEAAPEAEEPAETDTTETQP